ncbi:hypothetical protein KBC51_01770 [Candidatus Saccharibacteria bacterium]|nr:hypothetical protein [Candidatus Saccharibacteria bacterium]
MSLEENNLLKSETSLSDSWLANTKRRLSLAFTIAKSEAKDSSWREKIILGATVLGISFDLGPGNEWLLGLTGVGAHNSFVPTNLAEVLVASTATGLAAGAVSASSQASLGMMTSGSVRSFPETFDYWRKSQDVVPVNSLNPEKNRPDTLTSLTLGTAATVIAKNREPGRNFSKDAKLSLKSAGLIGAVNTGLVGTLSGAGYILDNNGGEQVANNLENIAKNPLTYISIFGIIKAFQLRKMSKERKHSLIALESLYETASKGPETEGLSLEQLVVSLKDPRTVSIHNEKGVRLPLFVPIEYNPELNKEYFSKHEKRDNVFYYTGVDERVSIGERDVQEIKRELESLKNKSLVVTQYMEGQDYKLEKLKSLLDRVEVEYELTNFIDSRNSSPAGTTHFAGYGVQLFKPELQYPSIQDSYNALKELNPETYNDFDGMTLVKGDKLNEKDIEALWQMYDVQFTNLISENPSMQKQTKEDFTKTLLNPATVAGIKYKDGQPICLAYFVSDLSNIYWLRSEYYKEQFPGKNIWYFPGIVTDERHSGGAHSLKVVKMLTDLAHMTGINTIITFQTTNVSKDYIPKIVEQVINSTGTTEISLSEIANYNYSGLKF